MQHVPNSGNQLPPPDPKSISQDARCNNDSPSGLTSESTATVVKKKSKKTLFLSILIPIVAVITTAVLLIQFGVVQIGSPRSVEIRASAEGVSLLIEPIDPEYALRESAYEASQNVLPASYYMLTPREITSAAELPDSGVTLSVTLPESLPDGFEGSFTYFDEDVEVWVPVETHVDGKNATATVDHLSLWSFVVYTPQSPVINLFETNDEGEYWFNNPVSDWVYRHAGLLFGQQTKQPECLAGEAPKWLLESYIPGNSGLADDTQAVLTCIGVDPEDPNRVLIKSASNRSYGHSYVLADGIHPENISFSLLSDMNLPDFIQGVSSAAMVLDTINIYEILPGGTEMSLSVTKQQALQAFENGQPIIKFDKVGWSSLGKNIIFKTIMDELIDNPMYGFLTATAALDSCDPNVDKDAMGIAIWVKECGINVTESASSLVDLENSIYRGKHAKDTALLTKIASSDAVKKMAKASKKLGWLKVVDIAFPLIDYMGETMQAPNGDSYYMVALNVDNTGPVWSDLDGTWCNETGTDCYTILNGETENSEFIYSHDDEGCLAGGVMPTVNIGGGANVKYCPAGAETSGQYFDSRNNTMMFENDDTSRDRIFTFQATGAHPYFRK